MSERMPNAIGEAFIEASEYGETKKVKKYIKDGFDIEYQDGAGRTAIIHASINGHTNIIDVLIKAGANVNAEDYSKKTALIEASIEGNINVVKVLLDANADYTIKDDEHGWTALDYAKVWKRKDIISILENVAEYKLDRVMTKIDNSQTISF